MKRRGFLGSVLGLLGGAPFLLQKDTAEWQQVKPPYRMLIQSDTGYIQAPSVTVSREGEMCSFSTGKIDMTRRLTHHGCVLLDERARVICTGKFDSWVSTRPGDALTVHMRMGVPIHITLEEAVEYYRRQCV